MGISAGIVGASGYAGGELLRLLAGHPAFELTGLVAAGSAGLPVTDLHPHLPQFGRPHLRHARQRRRSPPATWCSSPSRTVSPPPSPPTCPSRPWWSTSAPTTGSPTLPPGSAYYGTPHAGAWVYGLPELPGQRELIEATTRVAATGCYAVSTILGARSAASPPASSSADDVVVVAASGTTGAGRAPKASLMASDVMGSLTPYKVGAHQHVPEIKQATRRRPSLSFTPVLAPMPRGILATITAKPVGQVDPAAVRDVLAAAYDGRAVRPRAARRTLAADRCDAWAATPVTCRPPSTSTPAG